MHVRHSFNSSFHYYFLHILFTRLAPPLLLLYCRVRVSIKVKVGLSKNLFLFTSSAAATVGITARLFSGFCKKIRHKRKQEDRHSHLFSLLLATFFHVQISIYNVPSWVLYDISQHEKNFYLFSTYFFKMRIFMCYIRSANFPLQKSVWKKKFLSIE